MAFNKHFQNKKVFDNYPTEEVPAGEEVKDSQGETHDSGHPQTNPSEPRTPTTARAGETSPHGRSVRAAEQLCCRTCEKSSKAKLCPVAHPCAKLDFSEVVAVDVIWVDTVESNSPWHPPTKS